MYYSCRYGNSVPQEWVWLAVKAGVDLVLLLGGPLEPGALSSRVGCSKASVEYANE